MRQTRTSAWRLFAKWRFRLLDHEFLNAIGEFGQQVVVVARGVSDTLPQFGQRRMNELLLLADDVA